MPQVAAITINDGTATPVAYTFTPIGRDQKTGVYWYEQTVPAPANKLGACRLGIKTTRKGDLGASLDDTAHVSYSLHVPTLETLGTNDAGFTPAPTVAYREVLRIMSEFAERSSTAERKNTRVFGMNLLAHAVAVANIDDLSPMW
jgi:hypothetical protein